MKRAAWVIALLAATAPLRALAEDRPTLVADHRPGSRSTALELGLGWFTDSSGGVTVHVLSPRLGARFSLSNHAELTLDWPFAFAAVSPDVGNGDSSFRTGNPFAALYYMERSDRGYYRIGGGIAAPLASSGGGFLGAPVIAYAGASAMNGLWNIWQYAVDRLSLVLPAQIERLSGQLLYGGDFALAVLVDAGDANRDAEVVLQLAGLLGARIDDVSIGTRLQLVWLASQNNTDNTQLALVPFVQADFSDGGFIYMRFVLNLDAPLGVFADTTGLLSKAWGIHIGGGARF